MSQEWMLDLLSDLRGVAEKQAMFQLAEQLDDAMLIAARELRQANACQDTGHGDDELDGTVSRKAAEREKS